MIYKIIFIHGYTASSKKDWYPDISKELNKLYIDYSIPDLPGGKRPKSADWIEKIKKEVDKADKPIALAGHSLGTRAILLSLEKYRPKIEKVFLIATFANWTKNAKRHEGKAYPDFFTHKIDLLKIKPKVGKFIIMHSKDDPDIDYKQAESLAKDLDARLILYKNRGHFNKPENARYALEILRKELNF